MKTNSETVPKDLLVDLSLLFRVEADAIWERHERGRTRFEPLPAAERREHDRLRAIARAIGYRADVAEYEEQEQRRARERSPGPLAVLARGLAGATAALSRLGWELRAVEVDEVARRVDVQVHHTGGRWVHLRITDRGAELERWQRSASCERPSYLKKRAYVSERVVDTFLGRTRIASGPQGALRTLADYLADNTGASRALARDALRPALAAYLTEIAT